MDYSICYCGQAGGHDVDDFLTRCKEKYMPSGDEAKEYGIRVEYPREKEEACVVSCTIDNN